MEKIKLNTIEEAIEDFRKGEFVIIVDDEDRENEGDLVVAAELITPEKVNFMLKHARGVLCAPITISRCEELDLPHQVSNNTSVLGTPFTVTIDKLEGCTTGVSAADRAATIRALADPTSKPETFGRPGHVNPLYAQEKGVLRRAGHTEACVDMARLAGLYPAAALMEVMNEDGTMARLPELKKMADEYGFKLISIADLIAYRLKQESLVEKGVEVDMPTEHGHFRLIPFRQKSNGLEHVALIKGTFSEDEPVLVRVHSSCATGDIFGSMRCDCGDQLHKAMEQIEKEGKGAIIYLNQEGRGIGLMEKMKAYKLQEEGMDTVDANICLGHQADERDYGVGAQILREIGIHKMRLLTNNPVKRVGLEAYGLEIVENVPIEVTPNPYNERYLHTKKERMGHTLHFNNMTSVDNHVKGVECGADAYITKPFSPKLLLTRAFKLIEQREKLKEKFSHDPNQVRPALCSSDKDKFFVEKMGRIMETQLGNPQFTVDEFASMMGVGRSIFYRKVRGVTGYYPNEYIRIMRMKKAAELLSSPENLTVAEVSYQVGINDPFYFSKCFKLQFGVTPSVYQKGGRGEKEKEANADSEVKEE